MTGTEAANLFVKVDGDISGAERKLKSIGGQAEKTGGVMRGALSTAIGFGAASIGMGLVGDAMGAISGGAIGMNAELEKSTLQFETLMGSSEKAQAKVASLFDFAAKTPFESGPIIKASRTMQTFGGDALNTDKNLRLFGDAAAAVSAPIDDVSFWMSRAYAAIQGGKPFGEARMRLMELGIITPQVATKMEEMEKAGKSSGEIWGAMTGELGKFDGAMEKQAGTWDGLTSTMKDNVNMTLAKAGKPLFEMLKGLVGGFNDLLSSPAFQGALEAASRGIAAAFQFVADTIGTVWGLVQPVIKSFGSIIGVLTGSLGGLDSSMGGIGATVSVMVQSVMAGIGGLIEQVVPMFAQLANKAITWLVDALPGLLTNLAAYMQSMLTFIIDRLPDIAAKLMEWAGAFVGWILPMIPKVLVALGGFLVKMGGWLLTTALPKLAGMMGQLGIAMVTGFLKFIIGPPGLFEKVATFITGTLIPGILQMGPKLLKAAGDIAGNFVRGFIDFMKSLPGKVADVIRKAFAGLRIDIGPFHISANGVSIDLPDIKLPGFATGSWNVPNTGPALIHKGEMVIPADLAARLRGGQGMGNPRGGYTQPGGGITVVVNVGSYYGTDTHLTALAQGIGQQVRLAVPRRTVAA